VTSSARDRIGFEALGLGLSSISYLALQVVAGWCALGSGENKLR